MSTKAGTMGFSGRPALFTFWTVTVSVIAAAALIMSGVALTLAVRGDGSVTSVARDGAPVERVGAGANLVALPSCVGCDQAAMFPVLHGALVGSRSLPSCVGCDQAAMFPVLHGALVGSRSRLGDSSGR